MNFEEDEEEDAILQLPLFQPNVLFAFLHALMGLQKENRGGQRCSKLACGKKTKEVKVFTVLVPFVCSPLLLWGEKCRFPSWRKDLVERFCKASSTFCWKYAN